MEAWTRLSKEEARKLGGTVLLAALGATLDYFRRKSNTKSSDRNR